MILINLWIWLIQRFLKKMFQMRKMSLKLTKNNHFEFELKNKISELENTINIYKNRINTIDNEWSEKYRVNINKKNFPFNLKN